MNKDELQKRLIEQYEYLKSKRPLWYDLDDTQYGRSPLPDMQDLQLESYRERFPVIEQIKNALLHTLELSSLYGEEIALECIEAEYEAMRLTERR